MKSLRLSGDTYSTLIQIKGYIEFKTGKTISLPNVVFYLTTLIHPNHKEDINTKSELFAILDQDDCLTLGEALQKSKKGEGESYNNKIKQDNI